jgi:high-affinity nickel-transport protein
LPFADLPSAPFVLAAVAAGSAGVLVTGLLLGIRHGFDWDHIAAITDITSTTAAAEAGGQAHADDHRAVAHPAPHGHGGPAELRAHDLGPGAATLAFPVAAAAAVASTPRARLLDEQRQAIILGTLYALGHALIVAALGVIALTFGAVLPDWIDPIMGRIVGVTLVLLGAWVFVSLYQYARHGTEFRLRSRWMLVFDGLRYAWRRIQARLHGHEHAAPVEMSSYGPRTALGVGMIHGIGAETGSQALLIASVGGAAGLGLGVPMLLAFIVGLLISNTIVIVVSATGFVASQFRRRLYLIVGALAGTFSLAVGLLFLFEIDSVLPDLERFFSFIG